MPQNQNQNSSGLYVISGPSRLDCIISGRPGKIRPERQLGFMQENPARVLAEVMQPARALVALREFRPICLDLVGYEPKSYLNQKLNQG